MASLLTLLQAAARGGKGIGFLDREEQLSRFSYAELWQRTLAAGAALRARGVEPGDRVALVLPTGVGFFDAFFGALAAGALPVPLYPPVRLGRLDEYHEATARMLVRVGARLVVSDGRVAKILGRTLALAPPALGWLAAGELPRARGEPPHTASDGELAFVQFSSGTTVEAKPVALTHGQIIANVTAIEAAVLAVHPESPGREHAGVSWLPLYHDMGLIGAVLLAVLHGAELTLIPPELFVARPALWLRAVSRMRATISVAPDFAYALCADRIRDHELADVDLRTWCVALDGAEPVTAAALARFTERFAGYGFRREALTPVYGLSEAALAVTFSDLARPPSWTGFDERELATSGRAVPAVAGRRLVSVGRPLRGYAVRIADAAGRELEERELGRVLVKGPSVVRAYFGAAAPSAGGWLDTGDTGFIHDGELYLYGRAKDLLIVRGRKYAPTLVEQALEGLAGVRPGGVAAVTTVLGDGGEGLIVFFERAHGREASADAELSLAVSARVSEHTALVPARVVPLAPGTLPRTSSGKIRRGETLRRHLAAELHAPAPASLLRLAREMVRSARALRRLQP